MPDVRAAISKRTLLKRRRQKAAIFSRDRKTCVYCCVPSDKLTLDHVIPRALGGAHQPTNVVTACERCNRRKRNSILAGWIFRDSRFVASLPGGADGVSTRVVAATASPAYGWFASDLVML